MHSYLPHTGAHSEDRFQFGSPLPHHPHQKYEETWTSIDPSLCNFHFEFSEKHLSPEYASLQSLSAPYNATTPTPGYMNHPNYYPTWQAPNEAYRNLQYDSPGGQFGGSMSETSSDYAISPETTRQQMTGLPTRYFSPPTESHFSQQSWSTDSSFMLTPAGTPVNTQTPSVAMKELEFQGGFEYQHELQEESIAVQLPVNAPEELELSDSIATLTTSNHPNSSLSAHSNSGSDSSVSTPARDNDSDSDFDPKRKNSRSSLGLRHPLGRAHRRTSSSSYPTLDTNNRVHKTPVIRTSAARDKTKAKPNPQINSTQHTNSNSKLPRSFPCAFHAFGCPSTFANKNEWKRHITSQHLQLGFYRCDLGTCNPENASQVQKQTAHGSTHGSRGRGHNKHRSISTANTIPQLFEPVAEHERIYNDFNRKDLFTQHCRRMHGPSRHLEDSTTATNQAINERVRAQGRRPNASAKIMATKEDETLFEEELETIRARCWRLRRHAPERSSCGFCHKLFEASAHIAAGDGEGKAEERAWEERMEHLGKHYERDNCVANLEGVDPDLLEWGVREGILVEVENVRAGAWLVGYELPSGSAATEQAEDGSRRGGLRKRGPRRKGEMGSVATAGMRGAVKTEGPGIEVDECDEDAMADDD